MKNFQSTIIVAAAAVALLAVGCSKKKVAAQQPAAPPAQQEAAATPPPRSTPPVSREQAAPPAAPNTPTPRYPSAQTRARIDELLGRISDAYFDYNQHALRPDAIQALNKDSTELRDILKDYPDYKLTIEGHCDERGSAEYNMALGQERAQSAKDYLVQVGIPAVQLGTISYGKEKPVCDEHDEGCWQRNRRIHIAAVQ